MFYLWALFNEFSDIMSWFGVCCKASTIPPNLPWCRYCQTFSLKRMFWKLMSWAKIRLNTCSDPSVNSWYNFSDHEWCAYQRNYDLLDKDQEDWGALNSFLSFNMKSSVWFWAHHLISLCFSCLLSEVTVIIFCWDYIVKNIVILFNVSVEESYTDSLILSS